MRFRDIRRCPDCDQQFDIDFEEKTGRCCQCDGLLCADCFRDAFQIRNGLCTNCGVPMLPDDDLEVMDRAGPDKYPEIAAVNTAKEKRRAWEKQQQAKWDVKKGQR
jgi:hypothetical protein